MVRYGMDRGLIPRKGQSDGRIRPVHPNAHGAGSLASLIGGAALGGLLLLSGCDSRGYTQVSLQPTAPQSQPRTVSSVPLRIGLAPILSPQSSGEGLVALCSALSRRLGRPVIPMLGADYRETNDMLALEQLDVGIICSGAFADPRLDRVCKPMLVPLLADRKSVV